MSTRRSRGWHLFAVLERDISKRSAMRITQWLGQPAAVFIHPAQW
jgi:hypothetical protein